MDNLSHSETIGKPEADLDRFDIPIVVIALVLYVIERILAFSFLLGRSGSAGTLETQVMGFLFGQPPFSILDVLLGFDFTQGLFGLAQPKTLVLATIQIAHFWVNYWIVKFPIMIFQNLRIHID